MVFCSYGLEHQGQISLYTIARTLEDKWTRSINKRTSYKLYTYTKIHHIQDIHHRRIRRPKSFYAQRGVTDNKG